MKATKPQLRPLRRWSSSRGHMILTLAIPPKRTNSLFSICECQPMSLEDAESFSRLARRSILCRVQGPGQLSRSGIQKHSGCTLITLHFNMQEKAQDHKGRP